ncbi:MAG: response regulator [Desulfovibrionaceae bacterium]|nr:response regulator [Desulfovibrionaceae bacterium]
MSKMIFVVDDTGTDLIIAENALKKNYRVITLSSALNLFELLKEVTPDLILLDIIMPEMDGFDALRELKSKALYADIPVIMLTYLADATFEAKALELGAVDFISKPFSEPVLLNRVKIHLDINGMVRERTAQLDHLQNGIVFTLADIVENRDRCASGHIGRVTDYVKLLINALASCRIYTDEIHNWNLDMATSSARLHDVGKIVISDAVLNKPGPLTPEEFEKIKTHATAGEQIIEQIVAWTGEADFLHHAKLFAGYHHENWDGTGYPYGLKGTTIPLQGRIMAIIDVYDALVSERPYKKAFEHEEAIRIIIDEAGKRFDPNILEVFLIVFK